MGQSVLMRAMPVPMRKRILQLYEKGKSTREISEFLGFCVAAVRRVRQRFRQHGTLEPRTHLCGRKTLLTEERKERLLRSRLQPDATLFLVSSGCCNGPSFLTSTIIFCSSALGVRYNGLSPPNKSAGRGRNKGLAGMSIWRPCSL